MKKKSKWKVVGYSFLVIIVIVVAAIGYEYVQLQPKNHFKNIPVLASGKKTDKANQQSSKNAPVFNVLIMGSDARPGEKIGHSDTMMLAHVDLEKNQVNAVSIPRDTRVYLDGYGYTKLTSVQYILQADKGPKQGIEGAVKAISELTGVPINYYIETDFEGLQAMIDTMGGIDVYIPVQEKINGQVVTAGTHTFDGKMVLAVARERHSLATDDYGRQRVQLEALKGIAKKALNPSNIPKLPSLVNSIDKYIIGTNMSTSDMVSFGLAMKNMDPINNCITSKLMEKTPFCTMTY
ncbi:LCP family protein [Neobacillus fumarioli]|uniref:LCP family protein n=1 Tax=Neobacillus fumarioli TaxID=105229 RepID=UPI00082B788D|nr:LCP family protein [Neobacillus fumarioli]